MPTCLTTSGDPAMLSRAVLPGRTQHKQPIRGGPSPNKEGPKMERLLTILMMATRSCALTFTPCIICGMSANLALVDASWPLSSPVKSVVDMVSTRKSSATAVENRCGISWTVSFVKGMLHAMQAVQRIKVACSEGSSPGYLHNECHR